MITERVSFEKKVDLRKKQEMINFLTEHYRYFTMSSWNKQTSYAHNVKIRNFVPFELVEEAYKMLQVTEPFDAGNQIIKDFEEETGYTIGSNGRSGGYLVLYKMKNSCGIDEHNDFDDWSIEDIRERVKLVQKFDKAVQDIADLFLDYCQGYEVVEKEIQVTKKIKVLEERK